jgi:hypothetical protein
MYDSSKVNRSSGRNKTVSTYEDFVQHRFVVVRYFCEPKNKSMPSKPKKIQRLIFVAEIVAFITITGTLIFIFRYVF